MSNSIRRQIIRERIAGLIELGASSGIYSQKFIPDRFKKHALSIYRRISGAATTGPQSWSEQLFAHLWAGNSATFLTELHSSLPGQPASQESIDSVARMAHYAVVNYEAQLDDGLDALFANWAQPTSSNQSSLAQWVFSRGLHGASSVVVLDEAGQSVLRAMNSGANTVTNNQSEAIATIRTSLPETWICGHEQSPRNELQDELSMWLSWLSLSRDLETLRHARRFMLKSSGRESHIVIDEATPETSNVALMIHGVHLPTKASTASSGAPMRGLYLLHNSLPWDSQGYATRSHGLLTGVNRHGWKVDALTRLGYPFDRHSKVSTAEGSSPIEINGVTYRRLGRRKTNNMDAVGGFISEYATRVLPVAAEVNPEIIHAASNSWNGLTAAHIARTRGIPFVYEVRGLWEVTGRSANPGYEFTLRYRLAVRLETIAAQAADHVFTLTGALRDELVNRGVDSEKISLLPNCVDAERFTPRTRDVDLEAELGVKDKVVIGYVGSLLEYEGLDQLIHAARELKTQRSDFHILIVGSGAADKSLHALVDAFELHDIVTFTGRVPHADVERYYSLVDIAPFPRLPIPVCEMVSPLKPFEAMAMKKVCIVSSVAAMAEIVQHGVTGLVFDKHSVDSLIDTLNRAIDEAELRQTIGENARTWVLAERTWEQAADRVNTIYSELTNK